MGFFPTSIKKWDFFPLCDIILQNVVKNQNIRKSSVHPDNNYIKQVKRILSALCRSFINRNITLPVIVKVLKQAIVEAAEEQYKSDNKLTNSRVSIMTGVHRKDVSAIRASGDVKIIPNTLNARVIAEWTANPKFLQADGHPAILPKRGSNSFEELVISLSKDIRPRSLLDEWCKRGIVSINEHDEITLHIKKYKPNESEEEKLHFFGENLADHIAASTQNLIEAEDRFFERASYRDGLSSGSIKKLETIIKQRAMAMLVDVNKIAFEMSQKDRSKKEAKHRYRFGIYFYETKTETETEKSPKHNKNQKKNKQ